MVRYEGKRFIDGRFRERYNINHSVLYKYKCSGKRGQKHDSHEFLLILNVPKDVELEPQREYSYDWGVWSGARKTKPGIITLGTTEGEYTEFARKNVAAIYQRMVRRQPCPPPAQKKTA